MRFGSELHQSAPADPQQHRILVPRRSRPDRKGPARLPGTELLQAYRPLTGVWGRCSRLRDLEIAVIVYARATPLVYGGRSQPMARPSAAPSGGVNRRPAVPTRCDERGRGRSFPPLTERKIPVDGLARCGARWDGDARLVWSRLCGGERGAPHETRPSCRFNRRRPGPMIGDARHGSWHAPNLIRCRSD